MLKHGYVNFFERQCCFVADSAECGAVDLVDGARLLLDQNREPVTLCQEDGHWFLKEDPEQKSPQGLQVWYELPDESSEADKK